ncbi:MAG: hypothetical protein DSY82_01025 [Flavobacteriia bacterium]|nr:MAG: hypothetical protein DSY82_01025 [Flavobacteriia bacterium]
MAKKSIYQREVDFLQKAKEFMASSDYTKEELQLQTKDLIENYEELVNQVKIITKISDRLQRKLNKTNEKLEQTNYALNETNIKLNETIDALAEAKIGRKSAIIVMIVAIALFIVSEAWIEPIIDSHFPNSQYPFVGLGLKLIVAILIKPGEDLTNKYMLKKARKKQIEESKIVTKKV